MYWTGWRIFFLTGRRQFVMLCNLCSTFSDIPCGSVLGPKLSNNQSIHYLVAIQHRQSVFCTVYTVSIKIWNVLTLLLFVADGVVVHSPDLCVGSVERSQWWCASGCELSLYMPDRRPTRRCSWDRLQTPSGTLFRLSRLLQRQLEEDAITNHFLKLFFLLRPNWRAASYAKCYFTLKNI